MEEETLTTTTVATHVPTRLSAIERHIATTYARDMVAKAFYEVVLDGVDYGPRDLPTSEDREWIRGAIAIPIQEATELALHDFARRLARAMERAPGGLRTRYDTSHDGEDLGAE
jgi:hypothetical protein